MSGELEFYFWKGRQHEEVDFVVKQGLHVTQLIQVCLNVGDLKTREREVRSLLKASVDLECKNLVVLTESTDQEDSVSWFGMKGRIRFVPLRKWLADS